MENNSKNQNSLIAVLAVLVLLAGTAFYYFGSKAPALILDNQSGVAASASSTPSRADIQGYWDIPADPQENIAFKPDGTFAFNDYNSDDAQVELLNGTYSLSGDALTLAYSDRPAQDFNFGYGAGTSTPQLHIQKPGFDFIKEGSEVTKSFSENGFSFEYPVTSQSSFQITSDTGMNGYGGATRDYSFDYDSNASVEIALIPKDSFSSSDYAFDQDDKCFLGSPAAATKIGDNYAVALNSGDGSYYDYAVVTGGNYVVVISIYYSDVPDPSVADAVIRSLRFPSGSASISVPHCPASVTPSISVTSPQAGYSLYNGVVKGASSVMDIRWSSSNLPDKYPIKIDLLNASGSLVRTIAADLQNSGSYLWTYDPSLQSGRYSISVSTQARGDSPIASGTSGIFYLSTESAPFITSLNLSRASVGTVITMTGSNFNPLGANAGSSWLAASHAQVEISDVGGQRGLSGVLWQAPAGAATTSNPLTFQIPSQVCSVLETGAGNCPSGNLFNLSPGLYNIAVIIDGRGTSNLFPFTILP